MTLLTSQELLADPIGTYPSATVACFDPTTGDLPRRILDHDRTVAFLEKLADLAVPALLIGASTGQGHLRTVDELEEWFRCAAAADLKDTVKMALLRPEDGERANRRLVGLLHDLGYPVVFVRPGTDLPDDATDEDICRNMLPVVREAAEAGLAVGVYSISDVSGVPLTAEATALLLDDEAGRSIVAAKVTEANYEQSTLRFLSHPRLKRLKIVQGWDPHLARALRDGPVHDEQGRQRCGVTSGPMSLAVYQYLHIFEMAERGDWDEVEAAQQAVTHLFQSMQDDPRRFADLQRAKFIMGLGHPLTAEVSAEQIDRIITALQTVPRPTDRHRLAASLDLMGDGPYHQQLKSLLDEP